MVRCDEPDGTVTARACRLRILRGLSAAGAVRISLGPHRRRRSSACRSAFRPASSLSGRARVVVRRSGGGVARDALSFHRHLGDGHGHAGRDVEVARPRRPGIRSRDVSADERLPGARSASACSMDTVPSRSRPRSTSSSSATPFHAATRSSKPCWIGRSGSCRLPELIRDQFLWSRRSLVVAGTHGKTTTTALAGWLLTAGGLDPSVLVGGIALNFDGSYRLGSGRDFVIEGDEYDSAFFDKTAKFLKYLPGHRRHRQSGVRPRRYLPGHGVVARRVPAAARISCRGSGLVVLGADSPEAARLRVAARGPVETFGLGPDADWRASAIEPHGDRVEFDVRRHGEPFGRFESPLCGRAQRAERAGGAGRRTRRRTVGRRNAQGPRGVSGCAPPARAERRGAGRVGLRRLCASSDCHPGDAASRPVVVSRIAASGRSSSRDRRRRAGGSFSTTSRGRSSSPARTRSSCPMSSALSLPDAERLSVDELVER